MTCCFLPYIRFERLLFLQRKCLCGTAFYTMSATNTLTVVNSPNFIRFGNRYRFGGTIILTHSAADTFVGILYNVSFGFQQFFEETILRNVLLFEVMVMFMVHKFVAFFVKLEFDDRNNHHNLPKILQCY